MAFTKPEAVHFPRLNAFKSATNNIYLASRPVGDPRHEAMIQVMMKDDLNKSCAQMKQTNGSFIGQEPLRKSQDFLLSKPYQPIDGSRQSNL